MVSNIQLVLRGKHVGEWTRRKGLALRKEYLKHPKKCIECKKILDFDSKTNIFCSKECSKIFYTIPLPKGMTEKVVNKNLTWTRNCPTCGKELYHNRRSNAIMLFNRGSECRSCSKTNPSKIIINKIVKTRKQNIARIRAKKKYYQLIK